VGCFFFKDQLNKYWRGPAIDPTVFFSDLSVQEAFTSRGLRVSSWDIFNAPEPAPSAPRIVPAPFLRDFFSRRRSPPDLSPWILLKPPAMSSPAFTDWKIVATRRLLASLVSSASLEDDIVWFQAFGPPLTRIRADNPEIVQAFDVLTEAAQWVFLSG